MKNAPWLRSPSIHPHWLRPIASRTWQATCRATRNGSSCTPDQRMGAAVRRRWGTLRCVIRPHLRGGSLVGVSSLQRFVRLSLRTRICTARPTWFCPEVHPCPGQTHLHFLSLVRLAEVIETPTEAHRTDSGTSTAFQFGVSGHLQCLFDGPGLLVPARTTGARHQQGKATAGHVRVSALLQPMHIWPSLWRRIPPEGRSR